MSQNQNKYKPFAAVFSVCSVYIGTVVGAGFASGQEIWTYFGRYGAAGFLGLLVTTLILTVCGVGMLLGVYQGEISSYEEFCGTLFSPKLAVLMTVIGGLFMLSSFCVMLAGSGAMFSQELGASYLAGVVVMGAVCLVIFLFDIKGIVVLNSFLTPMMVAGILILGVYALCFETKNAMASFSDILSVNRSPVLAALVYVSYNLLTVPAVIIPMKKYLKSVKIAVVSGCAGGVLLGVLGICMFAVSLTDGFADSEIPSLTFAGFLGDHFKLFYGITIYFAMLTTAVSNGFGFLKFSLGYFPKLKKNAAALLIVLAGGALAMAGFSRLIDSVYLVFGYVGLLFTGLLFSYSWRKIRRTLKSRK